MAARTRRSKPQSLTGTPMADDPNPASRAELLAALAVIEPQIRGLEALLKFPISSDTEAGIMAAIDLRTRRRDLIRAELDALDAGAAAQMALEADGYPALDPMPVAPEMVQEILRDLADLEAAIGVFTQGHPETGDFNPQRSTTA